jgi:DNA-binding transcriptional ArsR family regulator
MVKLQLDFDYDRPRTARHEPTDRALPRDIPDKTRDTPLSPGLLELRRQHLAELAAQKRFPEIPRRTYQREQAPEVPIHVEGERHVRPRHHLPPTLFNLRLHPEEKQLLGEVGRFRVLAVADVARTVYSGDEGTLRSHLKFLREKGLVSLDIINARRDGRSRPVERMEVVTLTPYGERLARLTNTFQPDQKLYSGLVKPREVEHDTQIYRAFLKESERITKQGGQNLRVRLDFELKSKVQKAIYAARKQDPDRPLDDIKQQVAQEQGLAFVDHQIQIPDARIEYELDQGSRAGSSDIEVVTAAYRPGHLRAKAQAGFHVYLSRRDAQTMSAKIEGEHHLLEDLLDL